MKKDASEVKKRHKGDVVAERDGHKVIECAVCGFKHVDPIPSEDEIREFYRSGYYQVKRPKNLYPESEKKEAEWNNLTYREILSVFNKHVSGRSRKFLDVGCGNGFFMSFMKDNGWESYGVEISQDAGRYASSRGLEVFNSSLEDFENEGKEGYYDAVNLRHVLEHVTDPTNILRISRKLIRKKGMICVEVPNDFNALQMHIHKAGTPPWWIRVPDHINYFDFKSIEKLLKRFGFEIVMRMTGFPMELFILMGDSYIDDDEVGETCHQRRMKLELGASDELRRAIYTSLAGIGLGRSCRVYARLKDRPLWV